jgi:hypothetical protein
VRAICYECERPSTWERNRRTKVTHIEQSAHENPLLGHLLASQNQERYMVTQDDEAPY